MMSDQHRADMMKEMEIRGLDQKTIKVYLDSITRFAAHFTESLDQLELEHLTNFQRYLLKERKLAPNSVNRYMSGIKFFYMRVLGRHWYSISIPRVRTPQKIPTVLSEQEVADLINATHKVFYKAVIMTTYSGGLRNAEVRNLKVEDIDSKRMIINVRSGKGKVDGQAQLAKLTLLCLRTYWRLYRLKSDVKSPWLFVASKKNQGESGGQLSHTALGYILKTASKTAGIKKKLRRMCLGIRLPYTFLNVART